MDGLWIALGLVALFFGGDRLVAGASDLARRWGVSSLVIGLTVVGIGTSTPELAASLAAALDGSPAIAVGNVVGSNIANIGLILGLSALLHPLAAAARFLRREIPILIGTSALLPLVMWNGYIGRLDGVLLLAVFVLFMLVLVRDREPAAVEEEFSRAYGEGAAPAWRAALSVLAGLVLLIAGARALVAGAVGLARAAGVEERIIGLTVVAVGTSLPELASSAVAAWRRQPDIALGNVVGSNIFNVVAILGTVAVVQPLPALLADHVADLVALAVFSLVLLPFLGTGLRLSRWEGAVLLGGYAGYTSWLFAA